MKARTNRGVGRTLLLAPLLVVALFTAGLLTAGAMAGVGPLSALSALSGSSDADTTATDPTGTDPTGSEPTETTPTESGPTETTVTESEPTETTPTESASTETETTPSWPAATEPYLVKFASGTSTETQAEVLAAAGAESESYVRALRIHSALLPGGDSLAASLDLLQSNAAVTKVEPNRTREVGGTPNDSRYGDQWALPKIGWDNVFGAVSPTGSARVAILDTGVDGSHPDLDGVVVPGTSILDGSNGLSDPNGHGTAMAGIVAAETDNGTGVAGVGYAGVQVMPVTVLGPDGTGQDGDIIEGVVYAAENGADVILMAFSNPGYSELLQEAIDYAWGEGVVLVAAVGNDGSSTVTFPAGDRGVIGVSATDQNDTLAGGSNSGQAVFLGAPGTGIATTSAGSGYTSITGTSASAAHVAGAAALLKAASGASNGVIVSRLAKNAEPAGSQDQTGNGRLNVDRAVADTSTDSLQPAGADPVGSGGPYIGPYVIAGHSVSPTSLSFSATAGGSNPSSQTFMFSGPATCNGGTATDNQAWLSVSPTSYADFTSSSSVTFTVSVDITGLSANTYNGTVTVDDVSTNSACADPRTVSVTLTVNPGNAAPVAVDDDASGTEDTDVTVSKASLLANDTDVDGDTLSLTAVSNPSGGTVEISGANVVFHPAPNLCGNNAASFDYTVSDGSLTDTGTVTIDLTCVNDPPVAVDDTYTTNEDTNLVLDATAAGSNDSPVDNDTDVDGGTLTVSAVSNPGHGTVALNNGTITFDPDENYCGSGVDAGGFDYTVSDGNGGSDSGHVTVNITCVNDAPAVTNNRSTQNVQYTDAISAVTVTATDVDSAGSSLTASTQFKKNGGSFSSGLPTGLSLALTSTGSNSRTWTLSGNPLVEAGTYVVRVTVSDGSASGYTDIEIVVTQENAAIEYTGETIAQTNANLTLRATVWDSAASGYVGANPEPSGTIGDITKMWVEFDIYSGVSCSGTPTTRLFGQVSDTGTTGDGIGTATAQYTSSSESTYCVVARVVDDNNTANGDTNLWYAAPNAQTAVIAFYENSGQFVTGGGWIMDPAGGGNGKGNFGFNARYNKKGQAQGQMVYVYRGLYNGVLADYVIKSNSLTALKFSGTTYPISATLEGKCSIQVKRASDGAELYGDGNATFSATVKDTNANSGAGSDSYGPLRVYDKNGVLYKSVSETLLSGGNVVIHPK